MSWVGRKLSMSDDVDQKEVIKEYFEYKQTQEQLLAEFWKEYEEDERGA